MPQTEYSFIRTPKQSLKVSSIQSLLILVNCPEYDIQLQALDQLLQFTEEAIENKELFLGSNSIDSILSLFNRTSDNNLKKKCVAVLSSVTDIINHSELRRADLIKTFIHASTTGLVEMQDDAAFGLGNIAKDQINKFQIVKFGGLVALTDCLNQNDPDVLLNSLRALDELFKDSMNKIEFRKIDGIVRLIRLVDSDYVEICLAAFYCLLKLAKDDQTLIELKKLRFLPMIINLFACSTNDSVLQITIQTLSAILKHRDILNEFPHYFPNNAIIEAFHKDTLKEDLIVMLSVLAETKENRLLLNESGLIGKIIDLLGSNDSNLSRAAAVMLSKMTEEERLMNELNKPTNQELIGKVLQSDNQLVKRAALLLLNAYIIQAKSGLKGIPDLYESIISHMESDDPSTIINASECICSLSKTCNQQNLTIIAAIRIELIKSGLVSKLIFVIENKSPLLSTPATLALSAILQEEDAGAILLKSSTKIIDILVENIISPLEDLCRNSILALGNASKNDNICKVASRASLIDNLLKAINNPIMNLSHIAKSTLCKVIEQNSIAKYWLKNQLSEKNKIEDGFLDIGFAGKYYHSIHKLPQREELQGKHGRTFFEVNFKSDSNLESILFRLGDMVQNKTTLEQFHMVAETVINTLGGIKPCEELDKEVSVLVSELKNEQKSNILKLGSLNRGSFYHRALLFKVLCDRLGLGPCGLVRRNNKMAWNTIEKTKLYSSPNAIKDLFSINSPYMMSDTNARKPSVDDSNNEFIVDLIFKPGLLLHGKESEEYIKYYG